MTDIADLNPGDYLRASFRVPQFDPQTGESLGKGEPEVMEGVLELRPAGSGQQHLCLPNGQIVRGDEGWRGGNLDEIIEHRPRAKPKT